MPIITIIQAPNGVKRAHNKIGHLILAPAMIATTAADAQPMTAIQFEIAQGTETRSTNDCRSP